MTPDTQTYTGGCHCGKVRYEVDMDTLKNVVSCNCSICTKRGTLLAFAPAHHFRLLSGAESLSDYQFHKKIIHHLFCKECGVASFGRGVGHDGSEMVAVNARCLDDIDVTSLSVTHYDGKSA